MNKTILFPLLAGVITAHYALAGDKLNSAQSEDPQDSISATENLNSAEYVSEPVECTVIEVATQYESAIEIAEFHCIADPDDPDSMDGKVFELEGLPADFEQAYRGKLSSGRARLRAANLYRSQQKLIFTKDTIWSITESSN
jgi:hypothetical protein